MTILLRPWRPALAAMGLIALLLPGPAAADGSPGTSPPLTGSWQGGGRACNGRLDIGRQKLSWRSSFSRCMNLAYSTETQPPQEGLQRTVFQLSQRPTGCHFAVIELRRTGSAAAADAGWEAVGYPDRDSWLKGDMSQAMACPLVRLK